MLGAAIASLLVVEAWWVKVFASLVAALWIARLFVIGHDACHGSYTPNKILNKWIGRIAFLPSLTPYSLWEVGHNLAHHGFTNLKGRDYVWTMDSVVESPSRAAAEWTFSYVVADVIPRSAGRKIRFRGMSLYELRDGKIQAYREYFDVGMALLQLGFKPESLAKVLARRL